MQQVEGIGGVFLYADDPGMLARWYETALGISTIRNEECDNYYTQFEQLDPRDPERKISTVFAIFKSPQPLPTPRQECRINYRVADLTSMIRQLESQGTKITKREDYEYGLFAWAADPEGNSIELYQPLEPPQR